VSTSAVDGPTEEAIAEFSRMATDKQLEATAFALESNGIDSLVVDSGAAARDAVNTS